MRVLSDFAASAGLALLAALLSCMPVHAASELDRSALMGLSASLVEVEGADADGRVWIGTGVGIAPDRIVTSCHVTRRAESIRVAARGASRMVSGQSADTEHDLCILLVPGLMVPPASLGAGGTLDVGQPVWAMGFEGGRGLRTRAGVVRALHAYDGARVVESTAAFTSGASGGALFDAAGRLVGILTYRLRGDQRSYFSVPVEWFSRRLTDAPAYAAVAPLAGGPPFWQRAQERLPYFLRAHQLELGHDWGGLLTLAEEWCNAEASNAEAWLFRGKSLAGARDLPAARLAFRRAVALDPVFTSAWLELGRLSAHDGSNQEAQDALSQLIRLSPGLANCLASEMHRPSPTPPPHDTDVDACSEI